MLPDVPVLKQNLYRSGFTESHYNPRALITRVLAGDFGDSSDTTFGRRSFEYNATIIHERVHWLQHHGTSFGAFLEALRFSQQLTTLRWFRTMPANEVRTLLSARADESRPIVFLDPDGHYPVFDSMGEGSPLNIFRQIWFDHQWVHSTFEDSRVCETSGKPPGSVIGEVIGDVMLALCGDADFECEHLETIRTNQFEARRWFTVENSSMAFVKMAGTRLTSRMIMEAAATIAEMQLLPIEAWRKLLGPQEMEQAFGQRVRAIFESDYGAPIRSLLLILETDFTQVLDVLPTVSILCFLALNPPLPPYIMSPPEFSSTWEWADIYPPLRFVRLCHAVRQVGLIDSARQHEQIAAYIQSLTRACNLPTSLGSPYPKFSFRSDSPDFSDISSRYPETLQATCHDYVFWVQSKLQRFRETSLPFLVSFGDCLSGDLAYKHIDDLLATDDAAVPYAHCPLHWTASGKTGFSCPRDFGNWLIQSLALHESLFDMVAGVGKYDLSAFPTEIQEGELYKTIENSILVSVTKVQNT